MCVYDIFNKCFCTARTGLAIHSAERVRTIVLYMKELVWHQKVKCQEGGRDNWREGVGKGRQYQINMGQSAALVEQNRARLARKKHVCASFAERITNLIGYALNTEARIKRECMELTLSEISDFVHMRVLSWGRKLWNPLTKPTGTFFICWNGTSDISVTNTVNVTDCDLWIHYQSTTFGLIYLQYLQGSETRDVDQAIKMGTGSWN